MSAEINSRQPHVRSLMFGEPHSCKALFTDAQVREVVGDDDQIPAKQRMFQLEASMSGKMHYPNPRCDGGPFKVIAADYHGFPQIACPQCDKTVCAACKVAWHTGLAREEFSRHPNRPRSPDDIALLRLALRDYYRKCLSCETLTYKSKYGCNFVTCVCLCSFCYGCGVRYVSTKGSSMYNVHDEAGCTCGLSGVPVEHTDAAAVAAPIDGPALYHRTVQF